ncbi:MAG: glycosyltransferase family 2 protein [Flavobacterium sp.]|nr:MAG: glycosyltransferase family 2 protein [Flavobacterium sp.]
MALTSIITVNFHQPDVTVDLLKSIAKWYTPSEVEVILVDNGASNNMEAFFRPYYDNIKYIISEKNLGFAGGNNLGLKQAEGEYIFLLNNDTEIIEGCVEAMIAEMESNSDIGLLSPLLLYFDQKDLVQYAGFTPINYLTGRNSCVGQFEKNVGQYNGESYETGFCHGAAVMCRKNDLLQAGVMDESYFLYYEEFDWSEKFRRIGKNIWFTGKTHVYHKESVSVGKASPIKIYFNTRNRMLFIRKNANTINTFFFYLYYTLIACPKAILTYIVTGERHLIQWAVRGLLWNYANRKDSTELGFKIK